MTPTMEVFALLQFNFNGRPVVRMVRLIGIDAASRGAVGGFSEHLLDAQNRAAPSFELRGEARTRFDELRRRNAALAVRPVAPLPWIEQADEKGRWLFTQDKAFCLAGVLAASGSPLEALWTAPGRHVQRCAPSASATRCRC
jgi:hypothetical protein